MRPTLSSLILLLAGVALGVASKRWSHNEPASPTPPRSPAITPTSDLPAPPMDHHGALDYRAWEDLVRRDPALAWKTMSAMPGPLRWLARKRSVETLAIHRPDEVGPWMDRLVPGERDQALDWAFAALKTAHGIVLATEIVLTWENPPAFHRGRVLLELGKTSPEHAYELLHSGPKLNSLELDALAEGLASGWLEQDPVGGLARLEELWKSRSLDLSKLELKPETLAQVWESLASLPEGPFRDGLRKHPGLQKKPTFPLQILRDVAAKGETLSFSKGRDDKGYFAGSTLRTLEPTLELLELCQKTLQGEDSLDPFASDPNADLTPDGRNEKAMVRYLFDQWLAEKPTATLRLWEQMPDGPWKTHAWASISEYQAKTDPKGLFDFLGSHPEYATGEVVSPIAKGLAQSDPAAAKAWARLYPEVAIFTVEALLRHHFAEALPLLQEQPKLLDQSLAQKYAAELMATAPEWALQTALANREPDERKRRYQEPIHNLLAAWKNTEARAAWIEQNFSGDEFAYNHGWTNLINDHLASGKSFGEAATMVCRMGNTEGRGFVQGALTLAWETASPGALDSWLETAPLPPAEKAIWRENARQAREAIQAEKAKEKDDDDE